MKKLLKILFAINVVLPFLSVLSSAIVMVVGVIFYGEMNITVAFISLGAFIIVWILSLLYSEYELKESETR